MASSFGSAFAAARKAGKKEFTWNGKKYHTKTKEEMGGKGAPATSSSPKGRPSARPSAASPGPALPPAGGTRPRARPASGPVGTITTRGGRTIAAGPSRMAAAARNRTQRLVSQEEARRREMEGHTRKR